MRLVLELTHTVTETRDLHRARPLSGRALQRGSARVVLRDAARRFTLTARCVVVGRRKFFVDEGDGTTVLQLPALPQLDARAAYRFARWVEAFLSAENLTNRGGTLMPLRPTTLYAGLDLSF